MRIFNIFASFTLKWPWCDLDMTLVLTTSEAQLVLVLLFAHKLRSCWCLHTNLTLPDHKIFLFFFNPPPPPGIQRWGCKCAQEFSVKRVINPDVGLYTRRQITCIACSSPISQSIINRFWWTFARTILESRGDCREIFIKKYYIVQKLDHLTCVKFVITTSLYKPIKLVKLKFVF